MHEGLDSARVFWKIQIISKSLRTPNASYIPFDQSGWLLQTAMCASSNLGFWEAVHRETSAVAVSLGPLHLLACTLSPVT